MTSQSRAKPSDKVAFFKQLDSFKIDEDGEADQLDQQEQDHRARSRAFFPPRKPKSKLVRPVDGGFPTPRRVASAPTPSALKVIKATPLSQNSKVAKLLQEEGPSVISETPRTIPDTVSRPNHPSLLRRSTVPLAAPTPAIEQSPSVSTTTKKRKRQVQANTIPESEKIFRDLAFFYIPNNDIAPARKLRITKAQEHGARWIRSLTGATHLVVDKNLTFKDIQKVLGSNFVSSWVVVNEDYPIECMNFKMLLNPDQTRYRVPGCPLAERSPASGPAAEVIPSSQASNRSLQVKEPAQDSRRRNRTRTSTREGTPPREEELSPQKATSQPSERDTGADPSAPDENLQQDAPFTADNTRAPTSRSPAKEPPPQPSTDQNGSSSTHRDDLSEYIDLLRQYKDLPLDPEGEESDDLQSVLDPQDQDEIDDSDPGSEEERSRKRQRSSITTRSRTTRSEAGKKHIPFEDRFACNKGGTKNNSQDAAANPNARTIEILQQMCDYYTRINDHWRTTAYRKAISTLKRQTVKITTEAQAYSLPNIGRRLAQKIEEIVHTDGLKRLEYANDEPLDQVLELFLKIYDVGTSRANKWIAQGHRTLEDLLEKANLTTNQRIGIEHFEDLNTRIPREEVTALGEYVKKEASKIDKEVELLIGGSYRRGSESSGDIDFIVTKRGTTTAGELVPFLKQLLDVLTKKGFIVATLAALHARPGNGKGKDDAGSKWHGCCVLPPDSDANSSSPNTNTTLNTSMVQNQEQSTTTTKKKPIWRRIDFLLVPETEYGAALIYFTGNDIFNRSMRLLASKKGMRLNQRGLYKDVMRGRGRGRVKMTEGELIEGRDEKRIFEILGVQWREPRERWC
ncbi:hypothetical protein V8F20_001620 [Naviculisporaceae sp. PSN 640]